MNSSADNNIPLLTEIIAAPASENPATASFTAPVAQPPAGQASAEQLAQIRQDVLESVMQQVLRQVDHVLHQHLQDHLAVVLDNMADILKTRVRASMEQALAESVTLALEQEMAKFENARM